MRYRDLGRTGVRVSALGLGMMRLPLRDGSQGYTGIASGQVDVEVSISLLRRATELGINYIDTAYNYLDGDSEKITGLALRDGYREKVILATKAPVWLYRSAEDFDRYLEEQMERLGTDYVDVYLLHGVNRAIWEKRVQRYHVLERMERARQSGKVRWIGFSFHDDLDAFRAVVDGYPHWDLCQIQLNYYDTKFQAGQKGLKYAYERGLGVSIMEPLRGGYLTRLPSNAREALASAPTKRSAAEWAFDFLWNQREVGTVLSGMGTIAQVEENAAYADRSAVGMLTQEEQCVYQTVCSRLAEHHTIPCTGCAYCMHCPQRVAIPYNFFAYNDYMTSGDLKHAQHYYDVQFKTFGAQAAACIGCKKCEDLCPQHIPISEWMPIIARLLGRGK